MSPQSRAANTSTTFTASVSGDVEFSGNVCPGSSSVAEIALAANAEYALHKIESESSTTTNAPANPLLANQDCDCASTMLRKRSAARISTSPKNQPFLSSYGSAFLSGIFADIAHAGDDDEQPQIGSAAVSPRDGAADQPAHQDTVGGEPCFKKARITASTSFGRQPKSCTALSGLVEGAGNEVSSPSVVVSPRLNTSALKIHLNDQVRELQDMAFPSLPQIPITVSSSSVSSASQAAASVAPSCDVAMEDAAKDDGPSYGWFVSTDGDDANQNEPSVPSMFLPDTKPDLAFKAMTAPITAGNQDLEVQQALAADTVDDVLGDLF